MTKHNPGFCMRGHALNKPNTYVHPNGQKECKTCRNKRNVITDKVRNTPEFNRTRGDKRHFSGIREAIIQRDGERCLHCGMARAEHQNRFGRDITVDHIDLNGRNRPTHLKNNNPDNLQTLCIPCHVRKDAKLRRELKQGLTTNV